MYDTRAHVLLLCVYTSYQAPDTRQQLFLVELPARLVVADEAGWEDILASFFLVIYYFPRHIRRSMPPHAASCATTPLSLQPPYFSVLSVVSQLGLRSHEDSGRLRPWVMMRRLVAARWVALPVRRNLFVSEPTRCSIG